MLHTAQSELRGLSKRAPASLDDRTTAIHRFRVSTCEVIYRAIKHRFSHDTLQAIIRSPDEAQPDESGTDPHHIVVGVDGSDESNLALDWAAGEALRSGAQLDVMGSWIFPGASGYVFVASIGVSEPARQVVDSALAHIARVAPQVVIRGKTSEDPPAVALVEASRRADLLVVGSRGLGAFRGLLLGSVSHPPGNPRALFGRGGPRPLAGLTRVPPGTAM